MKFCKLNDDRTLKFKSGIFVDNFSSLEPQDSTIGIKNSVDTRKGILRPSHYTTALNLQLGTTAITGIGATSDANQDSQFADIVGNNIKEVELHIFDRWGCEVFTLTTTDLQEGWNGTYKGQDNEIDAYVQSANSAEIPAVNIVNPL
mgnify:CR=1 FL=1